MLTHVIIAGSKILAYESFIYSDIHPKRAKELIHTCKYLKFLNILAVINVGISRG